VRPVFTMSTKASPFALNEAASFSNSAINLSLRRMNATLIAVGYRSGIGVVRRLRHIQIVVWIDNRVLRLLMAGHLERHTSKHLVDIHVGRGTGALPGLTGRGLGNGAQAPQAHFDMFRDWQEITNSIFCGGPHRAETANGCLVLGSSRIFSSRWCLSAVVERGSLITIRLRTSTIWTRYTRDSSPL
jgi:hypothetical protein